MRILSALLCAAACGSHPKTTPAPAAVSTPVPNATLPATTDPVVSAVWTASRLIAIPLAAQAYTIGEQVGPSSWSITGDCTSGGTLGGTIDKDLFVLTMHDCGASTQSVSLAQQALQFDLNGSAQNGAIIFSGFTLQLSSTTGKLTLDGAINGPLSFDALAIDVAQNADGTVTLSLDGSATFGGTTSTYADQAFTFPGAP